MDGVTILNQYPEVTNSPIWGLGAVILIALTIIGIVLAIWKKDFSYIVVFIVFGVFMGLLGTGLFGKYIPRETGKITYQVTISDNVSFNEFADKYEIVAQDGLIYTVKEKSN